MAEELFFAVRDAFPVGNWLDLDLRRVDALVANPSIRQRHLAMQSILCIQRLRLLGSTSDAFDHDEAFVLLNVINVLLQRLLDATTDESAPIRRLHDVHGRVIPHAMALDRLLLDDPVEPESG
jgi:hypothetical protein